ncbi:hypothetical protein [Aquimarina spinulae]|uniref:hypothetical protein n=1 Tax=Aquimarina spinulae TaxID=1192023 RepID=UPI000D560CD8|nr:hypothetical protein [Aquimarina spinulae]
MEDEKGMNNSKFEINAVTNSIIEILIMKTIKIDSMIRKKSLMLLSMGLLVIAFTQIFSHYIELSDLAKGSFIGIGILLITLFIGKFKSVRSN